MLARLTIKNYILIHELEIDFREGLTVITGETGSGKSILLGALGLIIGQRGDAAVLLDKSGKCIVEGIFSISGYNLEALFDQYGLDYDDSVIIRREINPAGKSRAFINDTPVNLSALKDFGERLVNIHSQNSIITLNDVSFQLAVVDDYAGLNKTVSEFRDIHNRYSGLRKKLQEMKEEATRQTSEQDYYRFLLDELVTARLQPAELEEAEEKLNLLRHAEEIKNSLYHAVNLISERDSSILSGLTEAGKALTGLEKFNQKFKSFIERIQTNYIDLKDLATELFLFEEQVEIDPLQIETLTRRIDQLYRLLKKHQKSSVGELMELQSDLESKIQGNDLLGENIHKLELEVAGLEQQLLAKAAGISEKRKSVSRKFEHEITSNLSRLGIPNARFSIEYHNSDKFTKDGIDSIRFLFSANKGIDLRELSQTASGGELSRLMLSVKSMISQRNLLPTIIFDEIDNGVSGDIAGKVGAILKAMGARMQVIAITHLPQIAGKGDQHYCVYKSEHNKVSKTFIRNLESRERVEEIAKMLSNEVVTDAARSTAMELLNS